MGMLEKCVNLQDLAVLGFGRRTNDGGPPSTENAFWSSKTVRPSSVTVYHADCGLFALYGLSAPASLQHCTHLSLENTDTDLSSASYLLTLIPTVTHLAFFYAHPKLFEVRHLRALCKAHRQLQLLVIVHYIPMKHWKTFINLYGASPTTQPHLKSKFESKDNRIALLNIESTRNTHYLMWNRVARGAQDIWDLGRQRLKDIST
ncbi:hypothetical protein SISNIDRAFT_491245 [Sistotremastrum niveocremeum HHB9708]|uniref:Uncharacterized protein n=1 Tax=Sistotremastrum niveocremeum HHB9708 TaxID=1314777 RepID=A0A164MYM6_9AGAM|nr:hypothetical protein SISNIDRAFT_491245 [Sistotremastrum niveocremeum HHB9708]